MGREMGGGLDKCSKRSIKNNNHYEKETKARKEKKNEEKYVH
jgi:hypothetical protein